MNGQVAEFRLDKLKKRIRLGRKSNLQTRLGYRARKIKRKLKGRSLKPKRKIIGAGGQGVVIQVNRNTVRKELRISPLNKRGRRSSQVDHEVSIQKKLAKRGVAPRIKRRGRIYYDMERAKGRPLAYAIKEGSDRQRKSYGKSVGKKSEENARHWRKTSRSSP